MPETLPPPRGLIAAEFVPPEQGGGILFGCDCGTSTQVVIDWGGGPLLEAREIAYTCEGCQSVHWFTITPPDTSGP